MPQEPIQSNDSLIPPQPMLAGAHAFSKRVHGLLDGQPKDDATVAKVLAGMEDMFDLIAAGLYSLASMLVGEGEESVRLVEAAVANAEVSVCQDPVEARKSSRRALATTALDLLAERSPHTLAAPEGIAPAATCIDKEELEAAGLAHDVLERMIHGSDRDRLRNWLASLPTALRTIFVLRAVAGFTSAETAALLAAHGGPQAAGWTSAAVSELFRQGLCSLASQLFQASAAR
jgi:DNA-directed RNA polymerase specialized sigma24 family protein